MAIRIVLCNQNKKRSSIILIIDVFIVIHCRLDGAFEEDEAKLNDELMNIN